MEKLKLFFKNTHVITTGIVLVIIAVIWFILYLMFNHPVGFIASVIVLLVICVLGYTTFQTYRFVLGFVEEHKASKK